jgi:1,2-diacylglycerol 3-alpha-glucosyltransferase
MAATILRIRFFSERLSAIIAPTEKTKRTLREYGIKKPIFVIPSGIQLSKFTLPQDNDFIAAKKAEYGIQPGDRVLLYIGRIGREKNLEDIITYFQRLSIEERNLKLLIVGGGPDLLRLQGLIAPGTKNIIFTGMVSPDEVHLYYKIGDIFVTASTSETQGITYIEAMASGLPILCRQDECIEELVSDGVTGFTFVNCGEFIKKAKMILGDPSLQQSTIAAAKEKADVFSIENFAKYVEDTYQYVK